MLQLWVDQQYVNTTITGQVLMGAFLTRSFKEDYLFKYAVPTLTIGGELDGLARVSRMAEAFYTQLLDPRLDKATVSANRASFPVVIELGVSHIQFASGPPPPLVQERDLQPEVTLDQAHSMIAQDLVRFLLLSSGEDRSGRAEGELMTRLEDTQSFVNPLLQALQYEGYHNFLPPCLCPEDDCPPMTNCTSGKSMKRTPLRRC